MANTTYGSPYVQSSDLVSGWPATSLSVADRIDDVSFKGNGVNNQTATYTTVLTDAGKTIVMNVGSANDLTIQASGTAAYETGTIMRIVNKGSGATTVKPAGGVTLNGGNITLAQNQSATVVNVATDIWSPIATPSSAGGLILIANSTFSTVSSVSLNNCFTSTYANYRIILDVTSSTDTTISLRFRSSGTDRSDLAYGNASFWGASTGSYAMEQYNTAGSQWYIFSPSGTYKSYLSTDIYNPAISGPSVATFAANRLTSSGNGIVSYYGGTYYLTSNTNDGFSLFPSSGTITGTVRVYGYQNS